MDDTTRLPVFRAIAATFAFFAENWLSLLQVVWLPLLVQLLLLRILSDIPGGALLGILVGLASSAVAAAGVLKLVLRGEKPATPFYIGFGREEMRLIGTWCVIALLAMAIGMACFVVAFLATQLLSSLPGVGALLGLLLTLAALIAPIWAAVRLSLASPSAVIGPGLGIVPSWRRTEGQVWPMLGYWLVWVLLLLAVNWIVYAALLPDYFSGLAAVLEAPPADRPAMAEDLEQRLSAMLDLATPAGAGRNIAFFMVSLLGTVLMTLAAGVAWRMTEPEGKRTAVPPTTAGPWG